MKDKYTPQEIKAIYDKHSAGIEAVYAQEMKTLDETEVKIKRLFNDLKDKINKIFFNQE